MSFVRSALTDADVLLFMVEVHEKELKYQEILEKLKNTDIPILVLINKIDLVDQPFLEEKVAYWQAILPKAKIFPLSALHQFNVDQIMLEIKSLLPESPPFYDKDQLTVFREYSLWQRLFAKKFYFTTKKKSPTHAK